MSRYNNEEDNLAQQMEGFASGYDKADGQYMLTPDETEKDSELDENIYNETDEQLNQALVASESEFDVGVAPPSSEPMEDVTKKSGSRFFNYLSDIDYKIKIVIMLVALAALVYFLHSQNIVTFPFELTNLSSKIANPFDSASSSFSNSTSLGKNVANMARTFH